MLIESFKRFKLYKIFSKYGIVDSFIDKEYDYEQIVNCTITSANTHRVSELGIDKCAAGIRLYEDIDTKNLDIVLGVIMLIVLVISVVVSCLWNCVFHRPQKEDIKKDQQITLSLPINDNSSESSLQINMGFVF